MSQNLGKSTRRYIRGFDGLRALAVIGVIIFHLWPLQLPGGWLGVPLFFVLSGYLITDLLIQEFDQSGTIARWGFYKRRLWRLYPALVGMLLVTSFVIILFVPDLLYHLRETVLTNLAYVYNFWAIDHGTSYFQQFGGQMPFTHLWSLSIEGQFYLIWPFVVWGVLKLRWSRRFVATGLLLLALGSAGLMAYFYDASAINRVYYGTDTRMFAILLGTSLAFVWPSNQAQVKWPDWLAWSVLGAVVALFAALDGAWIGTYFGGMLLATFVMAALVAVVVPEKSSLVPFLETPALKYLGLRSYSIYLYQLPVFVFYEKLVPNFTPTFGNGLVEMLLVLAISELSYRLIEQPLRRGGTVKQGVYWLTANRLRFVSVLTVGLFLMAVVTTGLTKAKAGQAAPKTTLEKQLTANQAAVQAANAAAEKAQHRPQTQTSSTSSSTTIKLNPAQQTLAKEFDLTPVEFNTISKAPLMAIGDSVLLDVAPDLQRVNRTAVVDAQVGRQVQDAIDVLKTDAKQGRIAPNLLVVLGTNGTIKPQQLDEIMHLVGPKIQVYWMNNHVPTQPWQNSNNALLAKSSYKNLHVIDWEALAQQHANWFADDQVHQGARGNHNYVRLLAEKMTEVAKK